ncbi:hypothetical protein D9M69_477170 [compost metagenome]
MEAGAPGLFHLGVGEAAFRADQEGQRGRPGMAGQRRGDRVEDQLQVRFGGLEPVGQGQRRVDQRQHRTPALFAGADRHLAPVRQTLVGALVLQAHFAAFRDDRGDFRRAQLGGLLHRPVHALAARQALAEVDAQRRFGEAGELFAQVDAHGFLAHLEQFAEELLAAAVEQLHRIAGGMPQHAADVVGLGFRQVVLAEGERGVDEEAGQAHGRSLQAANGKRQA